MVYPIFGILAAIPFKLLTKSVKGVENIPMESNFIIAANHEHYLDPLFVAYPVWKKLNKKVHFVAKPTWWFLGENICRHWAGCIPLFSPKQAYKETKYIIERGGIIGIFPEGDLKGPMRKERPKTGAVRLAVETKRPILPIAVKSSYMPFSSRLCIGKPLYLKKSSGDTGIDAANLMAHIYKLKDAL